MYRLHRGILSCAGSGLKNRVSRMSPAAWFQPGVGVTGTLTASAWADQSGNGNDLEQGTAGNQPIYLPYSGTPYAWLPGVFSGSANYFSTTKTSITGDIDLRVRMSMADWTPAGQKNILNQYDAGSNLSYTLQVKSGGTLLMEWSTDGTTGAGYKSASSTAANTITDEAIGWIRATLDVDNAGAYEVKFYTSTDTTNDPDAVTWTQLGNTVSPGGTTSIATNGSPTLNVASPANANLSEMRVYRACVYSGIGGTLTRDFNPSTFAETSTNGATAVASTGETWTLNSTGAKPAQIVKSAQLMTVAASTHYMATAGFTLDQPCTWYAVMAPTGYNSGADQVFVFGETTTTNVALYNQNGGSNLAIYAGSTAASVAAPTAGAFHVFSAVFNGASSLWSYDAQAANTGDPGAGNPSGLTIGAGLSAAAPASARYKELIVFSAAHTAAERSVVRNYLAVKHSIAL